MKKWAASVMRIRIWSSTLSMILTATGLRSSPKRDDLKKEPLVHTDKGL
jgi:hypothetical protein